MLSGLVANPVANIRGTPRLRRGMAFSSWPAWRSARKRIQRQPGFLRRLHTTGPGSGADIRWIKSNAEYPRGRSAKGENRSFADTRRSDRVCWRSSGPTPIEPSPVTQLVQKSFVNHGLVPTADHWKGVPPLQHQETSYIVDEFGPFLAAHRRRTSKLLLKCLTITKFCINLHASGAISGRKRLSSLSGITKIG